MDAPDITVMVPALDEAEHLEATVGNIVQAGQEVSGLSLEIIIVNDGSADRTGEIAEYLASRHPFVRVLHHARPVGLGASFKEVLATARGDKTIIIPGDNDMSYDLILSLFQNVDTADLVLCFYLNREIRGRLRNVVSTLFGLTYMAVFGVFIQYINSPCLYPTAMLRDLDLTAKKFSIVAEATIKLLKKGVTFYEIPGYMQTGLESSRSLSWSSLVEVVTTFLALLYEIKWAKRREFNAVPVRVGVPASGQSTTLPRRNPTPGPGATQKVDRGAIS